MTTVNPQYIKDDTGKNVAVVLSVKEYNQIMEELEELDDIRLYDEAKKADDGERISLEDYREKRKKSNG